MNENKFKTKQKQAAAGLARRLRFAAPAGEAAHGSYLSVFRVRLHPR